MVSAHAASSRASGNAMRINMISTKVYEQDDHDEKREIMVTFAASLLQTV